MLLGSIWLTPLLNNVYTIKVDGEISADGIAAKDSRAAGGSGGSILILTDTMTGFGTLKTEGGHTDGPGSGGAGGRIAVYLLV